MQTKNFSISRIVHGQMRLAEWNLSSQALLGFLEELIELGVTTLDHADIYGNYVCEAILGETISLDKTIRDRIQIVTKCGIKLVSDKFPGRKVKVYDYSYDHIITSVENSLRNFRTDRIDLLLLHRPAPFFDPAAAARAFADVKQQGKVLHFGVSNFNPGQFEMLQAHTSEILVTNQVEISPYCLEHFENGNVDFFLKEKIKPMAWSPMAGGKLLNPEDRKGTQVLRVLKEIADELNVVPVDKVIYAWLLKHPAGFIPVVGSGKIERVKYAVEALDIDMSLEQWFRVFVCARGSDLP
ncbi:MAG: aldo/keto reductase [Bacteroidales bacterium]